MSKYSMELRYLIESGIDLGLNDYPIFNETYRAGLNQKILNHYYFHEIGFETAGRFIWYLENTMNEIMPYFNQLYQSTLLSINPLLSFNRTSNSNKDANNTVTRTSGTNVNSTSNNTQTINDTETINDSADSTKEHTANNTNTDKDIMSDTPPGLLSINDIESNVYATEYRVNTDSVNNDEKDTDHSTQTHTKTANNTTTNNTTGNSSATGNETTSNTGGETDSSSESGYDIPLAELLLKYRETFINIDLEVIDKLKDLFMMVY